MKKTAAAIALLIALVLSISCTGSTPDAACVNRLLNAMAKDNWTYSGAKKLLGEESSFFKNYELYPANGIKIKYSEIPQTDENGWKGYRFSRTGKVENIVFEQKYTDEMFQGIKIGTGTNKVKNILGRPDFSCKEKNLFGYRTDAFCIFFYGEKNVEEISVYPCGGDYDTAVIDEAVTLCKGAEPSRDLAEELAALIEKNWNDCNYSFSVPLSARMSRRADSVGLAHWSNNVELFYQSQFNEPILKIYGGYKGQLPKETDGLIGVYDEDLMLKLEKQRLADEALFERRTAKEGKPSPDGKIILLNDDDYGGIDIISVDESFSPYTVWTSPYQYGAGEWLNERYFVFSYGKGDIMVYDLQKNVFRKISSGFSEIISVSSGRIELEPYTPDNQHYYVEYNFGEDGGIIFNGTLDEPWQDGECISGEKLYI